MYSNEVLTHFENPRNVGEFEDIGVSATLGTPMSGCVMKLALKIEKNKIQDVHIKVYGGVSAIASLSYLSELIKGLTIEQSKSLTYQDIQRYLKLEPIHVDKAILAIECLKECLNAKKIL